MKLLILMFLMVGATSSFAQNTILKYSFGTSARSSVENDRIFDVTLSSDRVLKVTYTDYQTGIYGPGSSIGSGSYSVVPRHNLYNHILNITSYLSKAKLDITTREVVCHVIHPSPFEYTKDLFVAPILSGSLSSLKQIKSNTGCWMEKEIALSSKSDTEIANHLIGMIKALVLNF